MNPEILAYLNSVFSGLGIDYSFLRKNGTVTYPYFVGEYAEQPEADESGQMNITFILNGWTRGSWLELEEAKEKIADSLRSVVTEVGGYGVGIFYGSASPVPEEDAEMKRMQITLDVRVWRNR